MFLCNALLETRIRDLRQYVLSASRGQNIVEGKFHAERDELVVVFRFLPDIWRHKWCCETERFVGKAEWSWTVAANEKLLQEFSSQNEKMIEEAEEAFSKFIDDLSWRKKIRSDSESFWEIWSFYLLCSWIPFISSLLGATACTMKLSNESMASILILSENDIIILKEKFISFSQNNPRKIRVKHSKLTLQR